MPTYGTVAIQTFAHGVSGLTGNDVIVEVRGRQAFTDGKRVILPADGVWTEGGFLAICGVACHEVSHVWFRSTEQLARLYQEFPTTAQCRVQKAFNVVIDVADETRFERALPRAKALFAASREQVLKEALGSNSLPIVPPQVITEDQLLCSAILWSRSEANSGVRKQLRAWLSRASGFREVASILSKARETSTRSGVAFRPARTVRQWRKLVGLTRQLIDLLELLYPQQPGQDASDQGTQSDGNEGDKGESSGSADASDKGGGLPHSKPQPINPCQAASALADPMAQWRNDAVAAAMSRALVAGNAGIIADSFDWQVAADSWSDGSLLGGGHGGARWRCRIPSGLL